MELEVRFKVKALQALTDSRRSRRAKFWKCALAQLSVLSDTETKSPHRLFRLMPGPCTEPILLQQPFKAHKHDSRCFRDQYVSDCLVKT